MTADNTHNETKKQAVDEEGPTGPYVLVIEDEADLLDMVVEQLRAHNFRALAAPNMTHAQRFLRNQPFQCIVTDVKLPDGSGEKLIEQSRRPQSFNAETPIIVMSGHMDREMVERLQGKIQGAFVKPFKLNELIAAVKKVTGLGA